MNLLLFGEREGDEGGSAVGRHDDTASVSAALALVMGPERDAVAGWAAFVAAVARTSIHLRRSNSYLSTIISSWEFNHYSG